MKVNALQYSFGLKEIPYLGYVIKWEGIKPNPKKVHGIMDLKQPTTTNEYQEIIFMVQYYMYKYPRQYHILYPLTEAVAYLKVEKKFE